MIKYKIDVVHELDSRGYFPRRIRAEGLLSESTMVLLRKGEMISMKSLNVLCEVLKKQPGDIIEYVKD